MPYVTTPLSPVTRQLTFEEIIMGEVDVSRPVYSNATNTRTVFVKSISNEVAQKARVASLTKQLQEFAENFRGLYEVDRRGLYDTFYIPKKSGGLRRIDAPNDALMAALRVLKTILEGAMPADHHTAAFAYVKGRSAVDAVKRHQRNDSHWFLKIDFSNFFGSTTKEFVVKTMMEIFPFCLLGEDGRAALETALGLCFLDGGLPQGTPISPLLTNIVMIPVDHQINKRLAKDEGNSWVYTRYADDMLISAYKSFDPKRVMNLISAALQHVEAPYIFKREKTRYGSRAGSNWNLGVMLNKDNEITVGHKKKERFRAMIHNYMTDRQNGTAWDPHDIQVLCGHIAYYRSIEPSWVCDLLERYSQKFGRNVEETMKEDIR